MDDIRDFLTDLRERGLLRAITCVEPISSRELMLGGRRLVSFATNDYLNLAGHPRVVQAAQEALQRYGLGARAARLTAGSGPLHAQLEEALARFTGQEATRVFSTGYMANLGLLTAWLAPNDRVLSDARNHASIIDGCRLSGATKQIYPTGDTERLAAFLKEPGGATGKTMIVTESLFSMDGTIAPLDAISRLGRDARATLVVDDAHGIGTLGATGHGVLEHFGLKPSAVDLYVGTLSKALGSMGGFVAGRRDHIDALTNRARSFIFATGLPPACCAGALAAISVLEEEPERVEALRSISRYAIGSLRAAGFDLPDLGTPIVPVILGENQTALNTATALLDKGLFAPAIRPPTVPDGQARIRVSLSAAHTRDDVDRLVNALTPTLQRNR